MHGLLMPEKCTLVENSRDEYHCRAFAPSGISKIPNTQFRFRKGIALLTWVGKGMSYVANGILGTLNRSTSSEHAEPSHFLGTEGNIRSLAPSCLIVHVSGVYTINQIRFALEFLNEWRDLIFQATCLLLCCV